LVHLFPRLALKFLIELLAIILNVHRLEVYLL
jgi:hypothetical protein